MADYQTIVDQIRAFIAAADQTKSPQLVDLASNYAALCNEANARLRKCTDYIRRGLRAEAIHLAEEHPALLDMVSVLDLGGQAEWPQLCAMYELTSPPPLLIEAAQELNEGYAANEPLRVLLDRHRRLALEAAPLADRLVVMRQLAASDPASAFWEEDIRLFETACVKKIKVDATAAIKARDRAAMTRLRAELSTEGWRIAIPPDIRAALDRADASIGQQDALHEIRLLVRDLDGAHGAMNLDAVNAILKKISRLMSESQLALPPDLAARVAPADQWSRQQALRADRQEKVDALLDETSQAIGQNASLEKLIRLKEQLMDLDGSVPEDLDSHIEAAIHRKESEKKKQARKRVIMAGGVVVAVLATAGVGVRAYLRDSRGAEAFRTLSQHYKEDNVVAAQEDIKRYAAETPYVMDRADVKGIVARLAEDKKKNAARREKFDAAVKLARTEIDNAVKSGVATDWAWRPAIAAIAQANDAAKSPAEMVQATQLREEVVSTREKLAAGIEDSNEQRFRGMLADLRNKCNALVANAGAGNLLPDSTALTAAMQQASLLVSEVPEGGRTSPLHAEAMALLNKLKGIATDVDRKRTEADRKKAEGAELENIRLATGNPSALKQALDQFVRHFPNSDHSPRFAKKPAIVDGWAAVDDAAILMANWNGSMNPESTARAQRLQAIADYMKKYPDSSWNPTFADYKSYLTVAQNAMSANGPWKSKFRGELDAPLLKNLQCLKATDTGKIYYLRPEDHPTKDSIGMAIRYVVGGGATLRLSKVTHGAFEGSPTESPQSVLAAKLADMIESMGQQWETTGYQLTSKIADAKNVDPILRVILLERALNFWEQASYGTDDLLLPISGALGKLNVDDLKWMDPEDTNANLRRGAAETLILAQKPAIKKAGDACLTRREELQRRLSFRVVGHGALLNGSSGWTIVTASKVDPGERVFANTSRGWAQVAEARGGVFVVDVAAVDNELDGSMVFFVPAVGPAPGGK